MAIAVKLVNKCVVLFDDPNNTTTAEAPQAEDPIVATMLLLFLHLIRFGVFETW